MLPSFPSGVNSLRRAAPEGDEKIAQAMLSYWVSFAKTGDPSTGNTPAWPRYSSATDMLIDFTANGPVAEKDPMKARLAVTAAYVTSSVPAPAPRPPARP
jgi:para-nitrobenzyl esterase